MKKTLKKCKDCGKIFHATRDRMLCDDCLKAHRKKNAVAIRICQICGKEFIGGARAKNCPTCKAKIKKTRKPTARPLGSIDTCLICGKEYVVNGGRQKYCSPDCAEIALKAWEHDKWKNNTNKEIIYAKKKDRRAKNTKICVYCLREFKTNTSSNLCSDYCRNKQAQLSSSPSKELIAEREEYRRKVNEKM